MLSLFRASITPTQSIGSTIDDRNPLIGTNSSTVTISTCASTLTNGSSEDCCDNALDDSFEGIPETVRGSQRFKRVSTFENGTVNCFYQHIMD